MKKKLIAGLLVSSLLLMGNSMFAFAHDIPVIETEVTVGEVPFNPDIQIEQPDFDVSETHLSKTRSLANGGFVSTITGINSGSTLNVRSSPGTSSSVVGSLKNGTSIMMGYYHSGYADGYQWRYICAYDSNNNHIHGYIASVYLSSNVHIHTGPSSCYSLTCSN